MRTNFCGSFGTAPNEEESAPKADEQGLRERELGELLGVSNIILRDCRVNATPNLWHSNLILPRSLGKKILKIS